MIKTVLLGLVMVLLLGQLNAAWHGHHHHMRHDNNRRSHDQNLHETQIDATEANRFFEGYWKRITKNPSHADYQKAVAFMNGKYGASKLLDFNQRLAKTHDKWSLTTFVPNYNQWEHKTFLKSTPGAEALEALKDVVKLTEEFWPAFAQWNKRPQAAAEFKGISICAKRKSFSKLPAFNGVFGANYEKEFKTHTKQMSFNSGGFVAEIVLHLAMDKGGELCKDIPPTPTKAAIAQKEAAIKKDEEEIKKARALIAANEKKIEKAKVVISEKKEQVKHEEKKQVELKKVEAELKQKEVKLLTDKAKIEVKKADLVGTPKAKAEAAKAVQVAKVAEAKLKNEPVKPVAKPPTSGKAGTKPPHMSAKMKSF